MKRKFIFLWENSTGFQRDKKTGKMVKTDIYPVTMMGSDSISRVDGRYSIETIKETAVNFAKRTQRCVGFSVGYLGTHDPDNKICQSIIKFTKI